MSAPELAVVLALAFAGTVVQGAVGFGFALLVVPALLLVDPTNVPTAVILVGLPMVALMALRERHAIDVPGFLRLTVGRVPGTVVGAWFLATQGPSVTAAVVGALLLAAVALSVVGPVGAGGPRTELVAGFASGVMSTVGAVGGAPLGLAFQRRPGPEVRATLAVAFAVGLLMSLLALALAGEVRREHALLALALTPAMAAGLWASRRVATRLDGGRLRPAILAFAGVAGAVALGRALA